MAGTLNHDAVSVAATATQIRAANTSRTSLIIQNLGTTDAYIGLVGVTTANGLRVAPNSHISGIEFTGAIYGISASGTNNVRYFEEAT